MPLITNRDIVFNCPSCGGELVVDREGIGMECLCAHCEFPLVIPDHPAVTRNDPASDPPAVVAPLATPLAVTPVQDRFDFSSLSPEQIARRIDELKHHLKENMSQDIEMRGHVNRATIELHRLQLRLKKLQERQAEIEAEIIAAKAWVPSSPA